MGTITKTTFTPQLFIRNGIKNMDFYKEAFGAIELRRFSNDDGSIHVSEMEIDGALFHVHEQMSNPAKFSPDEYNGTTTLIGLMVSDAHLIMKKAVEAGAVVLSSMKDYDYGYRQGEVLDPFGHIWLIEQKI